MDVKQVQMNLPVQSCPRCGTAISLRRDACPHCGARLHREPPPPPPPPPAPPQRAPEKAEERREGGRRVETAEKPRRRHPYLAMFYRVFSLAVIVAAVYIVVTKVWPILQVRFGWGRGESTVQSEGTQQGEGASLTVHPGELSLTQEGETYALVVEGVEASISWQSTDPSVAQVDAQGVVTGLAPGVVQIEARLADGRWGSCKVHCNWGKPPEEITWQLNRQDFTLRAGEQFALAAEGAPGVPQWSSSNTAVATVSEDGVVTGVGAGKAEITANVDGERVSCVVRCNG